MDTTIYPKDWLPFILNITEYPRLRLLIWDRNEGSSVIIHTSVNQLKELREVINLKLEQIELSINQKETKGKK